MAMRRESNERMADLPWLMSLFWLGDCANSAEPVLYFLAARAKARWNALYPGAGAPWLVARVDLFAHPSGECRPDPSARPAERGFSAAV